MIRATLAKLLLAVTAASLALTGARAQPPTPKAARAWGFDRSDLQPHPGVRFGVLPNGMRYALLHNAAPAGALAVRLRIGAGAGVEGARERGFMHVLEHLVFQGSTNLPPGAAELMLRQQGLRRLDDFRAVTGFDDTVYSLDLPRADARARETALTLMREVATGLSFDRKLVDRARRSVRDELAGQDAVRERLIAAQDAFFFPGSVVTRGPVAGTQASVARARASALRRLYGRYYAPLRTTLVMVGDFDPVLAEREIAARFADWREAEAEVQSPSPPTRPSPGAHVFVDRRAETAVTVATVQPPGGSDAGGRRDGAFLEGLAAQLLTRRLAHSGGSASSYDYFEAGHINRIDLPAPDRNWKRALESGAAELARALASGFTQAELDQLRAASAAASPRVPARTSADIADAIVDAANRRLVFTAPADPAAAAAYLAQVKLGDVNAAFRRVWSDVRPLIFLAHNAPVREAERTIVATWASGLASAQRRKT